MTQRNKIDLALDALKVLITRMNIVLVVDCNKNKKDHHMYPFNNSVLTKISLDIFLASYKGEEPNVFTSLKGSYCETLAGII